MEFVRLKKVSDRILGLSHRRRRTSVLPGSTPNAGIVTANVEQVRRAQLVGSEAGCGTVPSSAELEKARNLHERAPVTNCSASSTAGVEFVTNGILFVMQIHSRRKRRAPGL